MIGEEEDDLEALLEGCGPVIERSAASGSGLQGSGPTQEAQDINRVAPVEELDHTVRA